MEEPTLATITQLNLSMAPAKVVETALQLGIFSAIAQGHARVPEIARATRASDRGTRMLVDALTALTLLRKDGDRYALPAASAQYLVRESPDYLGYMLETGRLYQSWLGLAEAVRSGKPVVGEEQDHAEEFFSTLVRTLHVTNREPARRAAVAVAGRAAPGALRVLDVACGSGVWGIAIAEANPNARITALDFPGVLKVTREYVKRRGLEARYDYLEGDLASVDCGEARFDLAVLGNICHSLGAEASRSLFTRLHRALAPQGRLAIVEVIPNEERTGPVYAALFALNMLLHTSQGGTYTLREYTGWLEGAGFASVTTADIGLNSPMIIAGKA
ncbi:MAG: methyltransferase [Terriglobia bacterium]